MPRSEWHRETWEEVEAILREHFILNGFDVVINHQDRTVTIIDRETKRMLVVLDASLQHYGYASSIRPELERDRNLRDAT